MAERIAVAGVAMTGVRDVAAKADEIVFEACYEALRQAGLRGQDVDQAMLCSLDLYDGRAISNGLLVPAAGGYMKDESRVEGDSSLAIIGGAAGIRARQNEVTMVVALNLPEIGGERTAEPSTLRGFTDVISNYTFDAHHARTLGMSASLALALQGAHAVETDEITIDQMAESAAHDISLGADTAWSSRRTAVTAADVRGAARASWPFTDLMLPAECTGVVALVLAGETRIRRARQIRAWISGWGVANSAALSSLDWLADPGQSPRVAAAQAYQRAGLSDGDAAEVVEMTALTPALRPHVVKALGLSGKVDDERVNRSGGVASSFPGLANGAFRLVKAIEALESGGRATTPARAVVHSTDNLLGPISASSSVIVLEQA